MNFLLILILYVCCLPLEAFKQVVIWGHKLHSHTHSYVHEGFYRAFKHLDIPTYWLDNESNISNFNFSGTLFITEGQVDEKIPLRDDCWYVLHYCDETKYADLFKKGRCIKLQAYTDTRIKNRPNLVKIDECIYYDLPDQTLFIPWATDLLPDEIDEIKQELPKQKRTKFSYWVGTIGDGLYGNIHQLKPFMHACKKNNIAFKKYELVGMETNRRLIKKSYLAPAIVGKWQLENGYVPCRIFKNISYGQMGVTNSRRVYELFDKKIVYNEDTEQLFYDAQKRLKTITLDEKYELMNIVKNKHTYLNRIQVILLFLDLVERTYGKA